MPTLPFVESLEDRRLLSASPIRAPHAVTPSHAIKATRAVKGVRTYSDRTFNNADWTTSYTYVGNGGTATAAQVKKGGSPGSFRQITDTVADASFFYVFNANRKAVYNPAQLGAITSINYSESNKLISGFGQGQGTGPAILQNGKIYLTTARTLITPNAKWTKGSLSNLTAADFTTIDTGETPDFSQTAAPIQFGFYRGNSATFSYTISAAIDNWVLKVNTLKTKG